MTELEGARGTTSSSGETLHAVARGAIEPRFVFNISAPSVRLVGSAGSVWDGAVLVDAVAGPAGETRHDHRDVMIQSWLTPVSTPSARPGAGWTTVEPGVRLRFPGEAERVQWRGAARLRLLVVTVERVEAVLGTRWELTRLTRWREPRHQLPFVDHVLGAMTHDVEAGHPAGPLTGDALVVALLQHLNGRDDAARPSRPDATGRRVDRVREYIDVNLARPLSLRELAEVAGLGVRRFGTIFAAETGWSPHRYLLYRRVARAKELMADPDLPLAQVAAAVGFTDPTQFSRVFRQYTGAAPRTYRRR